MDKSYAYQLRPVDISHQYFGVCGSGSTTAAAASDTKYAKVTGGRTAPALTGVAVMPSDLSGSPAFPASARITALDVLDVRFPASEHLDGAAAVTPEPARDRRRRLHPDQAEGKADLIRA